MARYIKKQVPVNAITFEELTSISKGKSEFYYNGWKVVKEGDSFRVGTSPLRITKDDMLLVGYLPMSQSKESFYKEYEEL